VIGIIVTDPGHRLDASSRVTVRGVAVGQEAKVYLLLNKPNDYVTTLSDERGRKTVMDLVASIPERVYPVGRLDRMTTGLLLMTNDGDLAQKLAHPRHAVQKTYRVTTREPITPAVLQQIRDGVVLDDGLLKVDALEYAASSDRYTVLVTIHSGKNRIIRRLFEKLGYEIAALDRIAYAGLTKNGVAVGRWRFLTADEIEALQSID
jgi:23S rRNA pseudouridine2605 synthase